MIARLARVEFIALPPHGPLLNMHTPLAPESSGAINGEPVRVRHELSSVAGRTPADVTVHRFHETIGGRAYHIEVTPVRNHWRAQLCRMPGMPTAMMPFYGETPDAAARQLTQWLALAHRRQSAVVQPAGSTSSS